MTRSQAAVLDIHKVAPLLKKLSDGTEVSVSLTKSEISFDSIMEPAMAAKTIEANLEHRADYLHYCHVWHMVKNGHDSEEHQIEIYSGPITERIGLEVVEGEASLTAKIRYSVPYK